MTDFAKQIEKQGTDWIIRSLMDVDFYKFTMGYCDLSPIQGLYKSWEVPTMARMAGVPESVYTAKPTDGLGIDAGDEAQFGCSYLEWDIMLMCQLEGGFGVR